ncbi:MAG: hypothetical protein FJ087_19470, partial [Deltaproteobacteria bacterium]|nr:hypothetical protein [Deltaproteobacteria bacterium]
GEKVFAHELPDDRQALDRMIAAVEKIAGEEDGADRMMAMLRDLVQSMAREVAGTVAREACAEVRAELQRNPPVFDPLPRPSATGTWRPVVVRGGQDQEVA